MKKIIQILNKCILIFLIIVLLFVCFEKYIKKEKVVKLGGYAIFVVLTESMEPTIQEKEMILVKEYEKYHQKDIVTYKDNEDYLITHRIMQIDENKFIAKGDNNYIADEENRVENIEGKVVYHSKPLGIFILYYLKPLIVMYLLILLIICIVKLYKEGVKTNENEET